MRDRPPLADTCRRIGLAPTDRPTAWPAPPATVVKALAPAAIRRVTLALSAVGVTVRLDTLLPTLAV